MSVIPLWSCLHGWSVVAVTVADASCGYWRFVAGTVGALLPHRMQVTDLWAPHGSSMTTHTHTRAQHQQTGTSVQYVYLPRGPTRCVRTARSPGDGGDVWLPQHTVD